MKTLFKALGLVIAGVLAIWVVLFVLGVVGTLLKIGLVLAVLAGAGWLALKLVSAAAAPPPQADARPALEKPAETKAVAPSPAPPEQKGMSEAEALRLFEEAKRKNTPPTESPE